MKTFMLLSVVLLGGCTIVRPFDQQLIDTQAANAKAYSGSVASDPKVPQDVQIWIAQDAAKWTSFSDWAHGRQPQGALVGPTVQTTPTTVVK